MRQANRYDKPELIEMLRAFRNASGIKQYEDLNNEEYIERLLDSIMAGRGVAFIEPSQGMILGIVAPCIWDDTIYGMHELAWWVQPEARKGLVGMRLIRAYLKAANEMKAQGRIRYFTMTALASVQSLDYARLGFTKIDENWMQ